MKDALEIAADWWAGELLIEEKREGFREALLSRLREVGGVEGLMALGGSSQFGTIKTDYDPDGILWDALEEVGIELGPMFSAKGVLPIKTIMKLYADGRVVVGKGYGTGFVDLVEVDG